MKNMSPSKAPTPMWGAPGQMLAGPAEGSLKGYCGMAGIGRLGQLPRMARSDARSDPMVASTADGS
jgi:hypothetical protein